MFVVYRSMVYTDYLQSHTQRSVYFVMEENIIAAA